VRIPRFPVTLPWHGLALISLCALYLLAGLTGHDPWKNDDAIHFGIVHGLLNGHNWLIPQLSGAPLETPPLYYWIAAVCGKILGELMPLHDAVRLASGLFGALFLAFLAYAGRTLFVRENSRQQPRSTDAQRNAGDAAPLIAIGCLGLLVPIHDTQPMVALLAASAAFYAGCAMLPRRPVAGGMTAGASLGFGFLAGGLTAPITLLPVLLLLPINSHWRTRTSFGGLAIALISGAILCAIWPLLLVWQEPDALQSWWSYATAAMQLHNKWLQILSDFAELLGWFSWPALPLALWSVWLNRRRLEQPDIALPLIGTLTVLPILLLFYDPRPLQALPLLVPLILLAANSAAHLRRGAANAFDWFSMMTFTILAGLIWLGGIAMNSGVPAQIAHNFAKLEPGFVASFSPLAYVVASLLSLAWFWIIFASPRSHWRGVTHWAVGITLMWTLLMALWLPWIDYGKTYRGVAGSLKQALPKNAGCIAGRNLGDVQRISFEYFSGIVTLRAGTQAASTCSLLLEQSSKRKETVPSGWHKLWEGHRASDRSERIRLYQRGPQ